MGFGIRREVPPTRKPEIHGYCANRRYHLSHPGEDRDLFQQRVQTVKAVTTRSPRSAFSDSSSGRSNRSSRPSFPALSRQCVVFRKVIEVVLSASLQRPAPLPCAHRCDDANDTHLCFLPRSHGGIGAAIPRLHSRYPPTKRSRRHPLNRPPP